MNGVGGGKFEPQSGVPREQAMVLVYRLREKLNQYNLKIVIISWGPTI